MRAPYPHGRSEKEEAERGSLQQIVGAAQGQLYYQPYWISRYDGSRGSEGYVRSLPQPRPPLFNTCGRWRLQNIQRAPNPEAIW
ncbi:hypothetical protein ElyMa_000184700 [Elysia marginata]|uniref:Uncharacterized protein n=1 Tax=Elysia marginata TaxID=1093978 RepID=A0AAV4EUA3_9GAST|nr:hypothetical protein ElyMa_000184700 [Elysia marginata]